MNATGYAEMIPYIRGEIPLGEAAERIRKNTRAYARRQITWLRHQLPAGHVRVPNDLTDPADWIVSDWRTAVAGPARSTEQQRGEGLERE